MKPTTLPDTFPTHPTDETIAGARAWLLEACEIDGVEPTPKNLLDIAREHAPIVRSIPGSAFGVIADSLILAAEEAQHGN